MKGRRRRRRKRRRKKRRRSYLDVVAISVEPTAVGVSATSGARRVSALIDHNRRWRGNDRGSSRRDRRGGRGDGRRRGSDGRERRRSRDRRRAIGDRADLANGHAARRAPTTIPTKYIQ